MPISSSDLQFFYTGGPGASTAATSLGGQLSTTQITSGSLDNVFPDVSGTEALAGGTDYVCIGIKNNNSSITLQQAVAYIQTECQGSDAIDIGVQQPTGSPAAVPTIANNQMAPDGITFSRPSTIQTGLQLQGNTDAAGNIAPTHWCAIWIRRTVPVNCLPYNNDAPIIAVSGNTTA